MLRAMRTLNTRLPRATPAGEHGPADEEHRRDDEQGLRPTRWS
jgi:hypothetical protein